MSKVVFKTVVYPSDERVRVEFRVPADWVEDYSDAEVALFYPPLTHSDGPSPIEGSLCLFALSDTAASVWTPESLQAYVANLPQSLPPRLLSDETWLTYVKEYRASDTHDAVDHKWSRLHAAGSALLVFTWCFTGVSDFFDHPGSVYYECVDTLFHEIERATISNG